MSTFKSKCGKGVDLCLSWVNASNGEIPAGAVSVGDNVYVARCVYEGEYVPGKMATGHQNCYAPYGSEEKSFPNYQVLCETSNFGLPGGPGYKWVPASSNSIPKYSLIGGSDKGTPVYIARAKINGEWCAGKYVPEFGSAYFPYGGSEHEMNDGFDVLVMCERSD